MGQEHPRVPGNRSPGRPVLPVEGKAGPGGLRVCLQSRQCTQQPGRCRVLRALQGGVDCRPGVPALHTGGGGLKELTCQELFTEARGEEWFTANLKESRMFNISSALPQPPDRNIKALLRRRCNYTERLISQLKGESFLSCSLSSCCLLSQFFKFF